MTAECLPNDYPCDSFEELPNLDKVVCGEYGIDETTTPRRACDPETGPACRAFAPDPAGVATRTRVRRPGRREDLSGGIHVLRHEPVFAPDRGGRRVYRSRGLRCRIALATSQSSDHRRGGDVSRALN